MLWGNETLINPLTLDQFHEIEEYARKLGFTVSGGRCDGSGINVKSPTDIHCKFTIDFLDKDEGHYDLMIGIYYEVNREIIENTFVYGKGVISIAVENKFMKAEEFEYFVTWANKALDVTRKMIEMGEINDTK